MRGWTNGRAPESETRPQDWKRREQSGLVRWPGMATSTYSWSSNTPSMTMGGRFAAGRGAAAPPRTFVPVGPDRNCVYSGVSICV